MLFRASILLDTNTRRVAIALSVLFIVLAAVVLSFLVGRDEKLAMYAIAGLAIFIFSFVNTDFALGVLIISMLFSPEFNLGAAGGVGQMGHRSVIIRIDDIVLALVTFSWLIKTAVNKDLGLFIRTPLNRPIFIYLGLSILATFAGVFGGTVRPMIGVLYNVKYFQYFLIFLMVANQVKDLKSVERYLKLLLITSFLVSLYAIYQIPSGVRVSAPFEGEAGEANTLGGYLILMMSMLAGLMTSAKTVRQLAWMVGLFVLMLFPFAFTLSRSSWIALVPATLGLILFSPQRKYVVAAVLVGAMLLPFVVPDAVVERLAYTFAQENLLRSDVVNLGDTSLDPSTSARLLSWKDTLDQWSERPFLGWGVTGAGFKDAQYFRVLAETGVVGLLAFFYLMVTIQRTAIQRLRDIDAKKHPRYHGLVVGYIAGFWGLLVHAVGANTFIIVRIMEPFWFLTALILILPRLIQEEEIQEQLGEFSLEDARGDDRTKEIAAQAR